MKIQVHTNSYTNHEQHSREPYGSWSRDSTFSVAGVSTAPENQKYYSSHEFDLDVKLADVVYVVSASYSSGDSFGSSSGNGTIIGVFKTPEAAFGVQNALEANKREYTIKAKNDDGVITEYHNPASGYFESLEHVSVGCFKVELSTEY